ncbi:hypothetical protein KEM48_012179 [Puccinia striiformis f. sp. tritici PST-130]|nr:hypothetical protein KEM48_012179 [Puccinia striiformis f. sp. tritici PST-130]
MDDKLWRKELDKDKYGGDPLTTVDVGCATIELEESLNVSSTSPPSTIVSHSPNDDPTTGLPEGALLVVWAPGDPDNPQNWPIASKCGVTWIGCLFWLPETYSPILLSRKAKKIRKETGDLKFYSAHEKADYSFKAVVRRTIFRPFEMIFTEVSFVWFMLRKTPINILGLFQTQPILMFVTIYLALVYGLLYGLFEAFPVIWGEIRGFTPWQTSLIFVGVGLGSILGAALNIYLARPMVKIVDKWHGYPPCEMNLYGAMASGPLLVIGILWLGWTGAYASVPWWVPALPTVLLGVTITSVFISFQSYLVDVYLMYAASALAATTIFRSAVGASFPLFMRQMLHGMGVQWACTLIGCFSLLLVPIPFIFHKYGARLRVGSHFAPALDVKMRARVEAEEAEEKPQKAEKQV